MQESKHSGQMLLLKCMCKFEGVSDIERDRKGRGAGIFKGYAQVDLRNVSKLITCPVPNYHLGCCLERPHLSLLPSRCSLSYRTFDASSSCIKELRTVVSESTTRAGGSSIAMESVTRLPIAWSCRVKAFSKRSRGFRA